MKLTSTGRTVLVALAICLGGSYFVASIERLLDCRDRGGVWIESQWVCLKGEKLP